MRMQPYAKVGYAGRANNMVTDFQDSMALFSYLDAEVDFSVKVVKVL